MKQDSASATPLISPSFQVLRRMDRNGDGVLEPSEVPGEASAFVDAVVEKHVRLASEGTSGARVRVGGSIHLDRLEELAASRMPGPTVGGTPEIPVKSPKTIESYAATILCNFDTNRDGFLDPEEAVLLGVGGSRLDFDGNGLISAAEIEVQFQIGWNRGPTGGTRSLPENFSAIDRDQDGQIEMHEFANEWTDELLQQFVSRDLNGDGTIELKEWLRHEVERLKKSSSDPTGTQDD